jgi:3-phenylpropionate/trans-cinnamate dioxygenase ferredoxin reductase subunit
MPSYRYLIIGGGMTGDAAIGGIREVDRSSPVGVIGAETERPYNRPPLSKALWKGDPLDSICRQTDHSGVEFHRGRRARGLDLAQKRVTDDQGTAYTFERLLLATGGVPRTLPFGGDAIIYYRTVDDYRRLRGLADRGERFAVVGGGFIGTEVAAALALNGKRVTLIAREPRLGGRVFPRALAEFLTGYYRDKGVDVVTADSVVGLAAGEPQAVVRTEAGRQVEADGVVAGIGIRPAAELAEGAGLRTGNGIAVDEQLRTSHPDVYAAGDVAEFYNPALGRRIRVEHEDNANAMGRAAGRAMAGHAEPYTYLPFFYSDLFDLGYEAVGDLDARLETVEDWKEPQREGVVYYVKDGRVRGVLLWNTWGQVDAARRLIAEAGPFRPEDLRGRLPEPAA